MTEDERVLTEYILDPARGGMTQEDFDAALADGATIAQIYGACAAKEFFPAPQAGPASPASVKPQLLSASSIPYEPPRWLLAPYFQRGKGTLIQGDNGSGKTAFMCAIAAHISTGEPLLGLEVETPGNVLMISVEDDLPVLRGRIEANGGDLDRCFFLSNAAGLTFNSPEVEKAVKEISARLLVFDPIQAFMGAGVDMFRSNETRPELAKLFEMCERNDCACAIVAHTERAAGTSPP